ncbi:4a-hydroxytetrahydrobiopterin dehydratase [Flavobacteriales bacterium]|jgi:4a-hydroxytetrahydrobiopterin dehydratase|nr:4a-hydroxytetrahydrobiopterin dehydratase [Flavobacteriales bacterium]MDB2622124.1 4a-hydroxytetrahydrobiopterin dehydratase [Flavobacteriales bacterium]
MMWVEKQGKLVKEYKFNNFKEAIAFINRIAVICEREKHHPEIYNEYNRLILSFCTHDEGGKITDKDFLLTRLIDEMP